MLAPRGAPAQALSRERLAEVFAASSPRPTWLAQQPSLCVLALDYGEVVADPQRAARAIDALLGGGLDREAMAGAVDPRLHRQRTP
jgi:hypothetical protein